MAKMVRYGKFVWNAYFKCVENLKKQLSGGEWPDHLVRRWMGERTISELPDLLRNRRYSAIARLQPNGDLSGDSVFNAAAGNIRARGASAVDGRIIELLQLMRRSASQEGNAPARSHQNEREESPASSEGGGGWID